MAPSVKPKKDPLEYRDGFRGRRSAPAPLAVRLIPLSLVFLAALVLITLGRGAPLPAQARPVRHFSVRELKYLLEVAKEPLAALRESRAPRTPNAAPAFAALNQNLPLVVTLWLDGRILARTFVLRDPPPLMAGALAQGARILDSPDAGRVPAAEEWPRVRMAIAVIHPLTEAADDTEVGANQAVVVINGFNIAVGLPKDMPSGYKNFDLLSKTCELFGLRSGAWLSERGSILTAPVDETSDE
jgi:hypothetical protein